MGRYQVKRDEWEGKMKMRESERDRNLNGKS